MISSHEIRIAFPFRDHHAFIRSVVYSIHVSYKRFDRSPFRFFSLWNAVRTWTKDMHIRCDGLEHTNKHTHTHQIIIIDIAIGRRQSVFTQSRVQTIENERHIVWENNIRVFDEQKNRIFSIQFIGVHTKSVNELRSFGRRNKWKSIQCIFSGTRFKMSDK